MDTHTYGSSSPMAFNGNTYTLPGKAIGLSYQNNAESGSIAMVDRCDMMDGFILLFSSCVAWSFPESAST